MDQRSSQQDMKEEGAKFCGRQALRVIDGDYEWKEVSACQTDHSIIGNATLKLSAWLFIPWLRKWWHRLPGAFY